MIKSSPVSRKGKASPVSVESDEEFICGQVAEKVTACLREGREPDIEALVAEHPQAATQIRQLVPALTVLHQLGRETEAATGARPPSTTDPRAGGMLGDYRIIREIGCGGMGVVYEAEQVSLGRKVALKVLPFAAVLDNRQLQRFQNEAQAAARLHHTNIVPVFSVGCERGVHYYAMQYIDGHPLSAIIRELRRLSGVDPTEPPQTDSEVSQTAGSLASGHYLPDRLRAFSGSSANLGLDSAAGPLGMTPTDQSTRSPVYLRSVANLGVQAAEALEHAHQQGVVHRDVKPSNLLLDNRGHLWITDFGLAQCHTDAAQSLTMPGDLLGTVRYMSPEQAMGGSAVLDHRTDIYSFGLTLYELLTLQPAFSGQDRHQLLARIVDDDVRPPRQFNHAIPADLETVVLKALAREPGDRYGSAQDLADDLRRFLENKPIRARPPTLLDRATKWCRRHRSAVVAAVALLVMTVIGLTISTVLVVREQARTVAEQRRTKEALAQAQLSFQTAEEQRQQAEANFQAAEEQRRRAEENFRQARDAVDRMLTEVAAKLANVPHMGQIRRALLEDALEFYEEFLEERSDDPAVRHETARAYIRVAEITSLLGKYERGEEAYRQAITILDGLFAEFPTMSEYQADLAHALFWLGRTVEPWRDGVAGDAPAALKLYRRSRELWARLAAEFPTEPEYLRGLGRTHTYLGRLLSDLGRYEDGIAELRQGVAHCEKLAADFPDVPEYRNELGKTLQLLGRELMCLKQFGEAEMHIRRSVALREDLITKSPDAPDFQYGLALAKRYLADLLENYGRREAAFQELEQAIGLLDDLIADFPNMAEYRRQLDVCTNRWHMWHYRFTTRMNDAGRLHEVEESYRQALALCAAQLADDPDAPQHGRRLCWLLDVYSWIGAMLLKDGQIHEHLDGYRQAAALHARLPVSAHDPPNRPCLNLGIALFDMGLREEAKQVFGEDLAIVEKLYADAPDQAAHCEKLARILVVCPDPEFYDPARAAELAKKAVQLEPENPGYWHTLVKAYYRLRNWQAAVDAQEKDFELRGETHPWGMFYVAMAYWQLGDKDQARTWYERGLSLAEEQENEVRRYRGIAELYRLEIEAAKLLGIDKEETGEQETEGHN
jgi:serine/threonine protein kinase/tetratricopeptide (TPR) repeat protein